jgi:hypothetical protein
MDLVSNALSTLAAQGKSGIRTAIPVLEWTVLPQYISFWQRIMNGLDVV